MELLRAERRPEQSTPSRVDPGSGIRLTENTVTGPTVALVTGANQGIGREIVARLAELGMTALLAARDPRRGVVHHA